VVRTHVQVSRLQCACGRRECELYCLNSSTHPPPLWAASQLQVWQDGQQTSTWSRIWLLPRVCASSMLSQLLLLLHADSLMLPLLLPAENAAEMLDCCWCSWRATVMHSCVALAEQQGASE